MKADTDITAVEPADSMDSAGSELARIEIRESDLELVVTEKTLDTLNINSTIQYANTLKQNRERARIAEEARRRAEEMAKKEAEPVEQSIPFADPYEEEEIGDEPGDEPTQPSTVVEKTVELLNALSV